MLVHGPFNNWGSALFSPRYPLVRYQLPETSNLRAFGAYLAMAMVQLPDGIEAFITSVHARAGRATPVQLGELRPDDLKRPSARTVLTNDAIFGGLRSLAHDRFIVAGDWNTARHQGSEERDRIGTEFFERAREAGWYDCVWEKHGEEIQTWFGGGELRQDDHAFCDPSLGELLGESWAASHAAKRLGLSLHAPLILEFDIDAIGMTSLSPPP
jgi:hypothetical protein